MDGLVPSRGMMLWREKVWGERRFEIWGVDLEHLCGRRHPNFTLKFPGADLVVLVDFPRDTGEPGLCAVI